MSHHHHHVTVRFVGICTHISQKTLPALPAKQRVVLVNARRENDVRGLLIAPHLPGLQIGGVQRELDGCTLRLRTASAPSTLLITDTFLALPNLTELVGALTTLGEPSAEVVLHADREHSLGYFDIDFGTLRACQDTNGAAVATLEVESPDPIWLEIEKWDGSEVEVIELPRNEIVWIGNVDAVPPNAVGPVDPDVPFLRNEFPFRDFLLHYRTAATMPAAPQIPQSFQLPQCPFVQVFATVGVGCSNSNYP